LGRVSTSLSFRARRLAAPSASVAVAAVLAVLGSGCGSREGTADLVNGKAQFVQKCGSCHVLDRAGTAGKTGPNLDQAFGPARRDGLGGGTIAGVTYDQILYPGNDSPMPAEIVTGRDAHDVAAYVGRVAGLTGQDQGALATAGLAGATDGKQIFTAAGCGGCHVLADAGGTGSIGPPLDNLAAETKKRAGGGTPEKYVSESILNPNAVVAPGFSAGVMPQNYGDQLTPEQVKALTDYLLRVGGG
jgi:mono/diheme cytochrome c family protein